jgi:NAD(P)-dependent dehydrogenase (short-subunit alcohol dehydrogenase family)
VGRDLFDLTGKVTIVTGSGRGLGKVIAKGMAEYGATIVTSSRTESEAQQTAQEIQDAGGTAASFRCDTSVRQQCQDLVDFAVQRFGKLDVLVNNAGIDIIKPAVEYSEDEWDQVLNINLKGYFNCAQIAGRQMLKQGTGGSIVNNSSIAAQIGVQGLTPYSAAKGGVNQITKVMAVEWADQGIRVNCVSPGYFLNIMQGATQEHARSEKEQQVITFTAMHRRGRPEELIGPFVFFASEAGSYVTGAVLPVDGGYTAM